MPLYDFECSTCGFRSEDFDGIRGDKVRNCPECGEYSYYRCIGAGGGFIIDTVRDTRGTPIWHPGKPYFDKSLQRRFDTKKEKAKYMKDNGIVMDGSSNKSNVKDKESLIEGVDR
jgi:putative FmdB family regulatory protein